MRYAAGYVLHSLKKKINRSAHRNKKEILIRISELEEVAGIVKLNILYMHCQSNVIIIAHYYHLQVASI